MLYYVAWPLTYPPLSGTVYLQTQDATSVLTGFGVFSCASALFMFPIIYSYLQRAIEVNSAGWTSVVCVYIASFKDLPD